MKKLFIIIIVILMLLVPLFNYVLKKEHKVTYKVNNYSIIEHYYKNKGNNYDFIINKKDSSYVLSLYNKKSKKSKIIKNIKNFKHNNIKCLLLITDKKQYDIACLKDNKQVSIDYLLKTNNEDFKEIKNKIKKYKLTYPSSRNKNTSYKSLKVYNNNIHKDLVYYIWNYKGLLIINNSTNKYQKVLDYDLYDNIEACTVKDYYVLLENNSVAGIEKIYYYNGKKINSYKLPTKISKNSYINGVRNNLIYITDRENQKEYTLDIMNKKWKEIVQEETSYITYNNNDKQVLTKSDFFIEDQLFKTDMINNYKYYQEDNKIYKKLGDNTILLLELEDIKEWYIENNEVIILQEDTIYSYNDQNGLRKIVENSELKYNYHNIYKIGKK